MANTPKLLAQATLTDGGPDTVYTVPADTTAIIQYVSVTNTDSSNSRSVDIKAGDSGSEKYWRSNVSIGADDSLEFNGNFILEAADRLVMTSTNGTDLDVLVCGYEVT